MRAVLLLGFVACSARKEPAAAIAPHAAPLASEAARGAAIDAGVTDGKRWFAGDLHMHVAPPDAPDVKLSASEVARRAHDAKMDFVVLTPHLWEGQQRPAFDAAWRTLAAEARATTSITLIPGVEWTTRRGHFGVMGADIASLHGDFLAAAHAAGAFISVNHPFAVPTKIGAIPESYFDMSYRVWSERALGFTAIDGVEVWNLPLGLANMISRPGGRSGEERAWTEANRVVHDEHRRITAVGGTDNHRETVLPTTWVLADDRSEPAILAGLRVGATCVGGPEAGSLRARSAEDPTWRRIGASVTAPHALELAWEGTAHLFIDDVDQGEHAGGFTHDTGGTLHTYRIVIDVSRCGFIYANL